MWIIKFIGSVLISLLLFAGFKFVPLLSSGQSDIATFIKNYEKIIYALIVVSFIGQQIYIRWPKRASSAEIRANEDVIKVLLMRICDKYYKFYKFNINNVEAPTIRINIMLPTYGFFRNFKYQKIYYYYGGKLIYNPAELELEWKAGIGCSGDAWSKQSVALFDSQNPDMQRPRESLTDSHNNVIGHVKSVVSIPITDVKNEIIGILNIDSTYNIDKTKFDYEDIIDLFRGGALLVSTVLCRNGVKP